MHHAIRGTLCILPCLWTATAPAQTFPARPVTIVVPFAAGGPSDSIARIINAELSARWGQQVVIENRPGGGTVIGTQVVVNSQPDGHTVLSGSFANVTNEFLFPKLPYGPTALTPVAFLGYYPLILFMGASIPATRVPDLVALVKRSGKPLVVGNAGNGSSAHLAAVDFGQAAGLAMTSVPYKGSQPSMVDLMGGQIDAMFEGATYKGLADAGKVKAMFVGQPARMPQWASLQTAAEAGLPGYTSAGWYGIFVPARTPADIQAKLNADFNAVLALPKVRARLLELGLALEAMTQSRFAEHLDRERTRLGALIRRHGIRIE